MKAARSGWLLKLRDRKAQGLPGISAVSVLSPTLTKDWGGDEELG